jgi:hypothetical protein
MVLLTTNSQSEIESQPQLWILLISGIKCKSLKIKIIITRPLSSKVLTNIRMIVWQCLALVKKQNRLLANFFWYIITEEAMRFSWVNPNCTITLEFGTHLWRVERVEPTQIIFELFQIMMLHLYISGCSTKYEELVLCCYSRKVTTKYQVPTNCNSRTVGKWQLLEIVY